MKRVLFIFLVLTLTATLIAGCSGNSEPADDQGENPNGSAPDGTYYLSQLSNGDAVGLLTINNISFSESKATFDLQGDISLAGEIYYDDFTSSLWFKVTDQPDLPVILIDSFDEDLEYSPHTLYFRNYNSFYNSLPASTIKEVKNNLGKVKANIQVKNLNAWVKADYYETGCDFISVANNTSDAASATEDNARKETELLASYQVGEEYQYDIDGDQQIDSFSLTTDGMEELTLLINEWDYRAALEDINPELLNWRYRMVNIDGSGKQAFVLYVAAPPDEHQVFFLEYQNKGYGESEVDQKETEELKKIGVATIDAELFDYNWDTLFNSEIELSRQQVIIGSVTFTFSN